MRELFVKAYNVESGATKYLKELACNSDETKPTADLIDGSICLETDSGKLFFFNEDSGDWVEQFSFKAT